MSDGTTLSTMEPRVLRVLFTGSRTWDAFDLCVKLLGALVAQYKCKIVVVHGACPGGVDAAVDRAAKFCGLGVEPHQANWDDLSHPEARVKVGNYGKKYNANAGPCRNSEMVALGADLCVAMSQDLPKSSGTWDCAKKAIRAHIPTYHIRSEDGVGHRITRLTSTRVEYER